MDKAPDSFIVVTRYTTPNGKVINHGYGTRTKRQNANTLMRRILAEANNNPRLEAFVVQVHDL